MDKEIFKSRAITDVAPEQKLKYVILSASANADLSQPSIPLEPIYHINKSMEVGDCSFYGKNSRLYVLDRTIDQEFELTNFSIAITKRIKYLDNHGVPFDRGYSIIVFTINRTYHADITGEEFLDFRWLRKATNDEGLINPLVKGAINYLRLYMSEIIKDIPEEIVCSKSGWNTIHEDPCFSHASGSIGNVKVPMKTQGENGLNYDINISPKTAFDFILEKMLRVAVPTQTVPILLQFMLGLLQTLFIEAGFSTRHVMVITGRSNSFKTSIAAVFCNIYTDCRKAFVSFKSTKCGVEAVMPLYKDCCMLIDDMYPPSNAHELADITDKYESTIRFFGDSITKIRMSKDGGYSEGAEPQGTCIITGEFIPKTSFSTRSRCLYVEAERDTCNLDILSYCQAHHLIYTTYVHNFLIWSQKNYNILVSFISYYKDDLRAKYRGKYEIPRHTDCFISMQIMTEIFFAYAVSLQLLPMQVANNYYQEWMSIIEYTVNENSQLIKNYDFGVMFLIGIKNSTSNGKAVILPCESHQPKPNNFIGYSDGSFFYLKGDIAIKCVRIYWQEQNVPFQLGIHEINVALSALDAIVVTHESRNGVPKPVYSQKRSHGEDRERYMVIKRDRMNELLDV